jgi:hypothetical protein
MLNQGYLSAKDISRGYPFRISMVILRISKLSILILTYLAGQYAVQAGAGREHRCLIHSMLRNINILE